MALVGWILILIGIAFELLALAGAAQKIAADPAIAVAADDGPFSWLISLIEALAKAPVWLASFAVGLILIYLGASMTGNPLSLPTS